jgi:putative hydrolase of the HAD superfamily
MLEWQHIDTVFLDMDGTLLDLNFDNYFWQQHVPQRYAELHNISVENAKKILFPRFKKVEGTIDWYSVDYWTEELDLDIALLKEEVDHLIAVHPHVVEFLGALRMQNKTVALVTNAHTKSLNLKMQRTQLAGHFDHIICAHDYNTPKENTEFWQVLSLQLHYEPLRTLLVDDSLAVLRSAQRYGIGHLLSVQRPDSQNPSRNITEFPAIHSFTDIMP